MNKLAWIGPILALLAGDLAAAHKHLWVTIVDEPDSELCKAAAAAIKSHFESTDTRRLTDTFRRFGSIPTTDVQIQGLSFPVLRNQSLATLDQQGVRREWIESYYAVDLDNNGVVDMVSLVSGGHLKAGEGDTLSVMDRNYMTLPQPVSHEALRDGRALEIGPLEVYFTGRDFDNGYFVFPTAFKQRNYLLLEGNGDESEGDDIHRQVVELLPDMTIVGRCYF